MSRAQLAACAARLPSDKAAMFLALMGAAENLFHRSVETRQMAWDLYRAHVPPEQQRAARKPAAGKRGAR
jgi:hypothetical protein